MNVRIFIEVIDGGHRAVLDFLFGGDADVAQDRTGELGKEALDKVEPRAVLWREGEFEAPDALFGKPSLCLARGVGGMIVNNQMGWSREPCFGVKVNSKRPRRCSASQAFVSREVWAE